MSASEGASFEKFRIFTLHFLSIAIKHNSENHVQLAFNHSKKNHSEICVEIMSLILILK